MTHTEIRTALEMGVPFISLYALIPQDERKALDRFVRCFGLSAANLHEGLRKEAI